MLLVTDASIPTTTHVIATSPLAPCGRTQKVTRPGQPILRQVVARPHRTKPGPHSPAQESADRSLVLGDVEGEVECLVAHDHDEVGGKGTGFWEGDPI